MRTLKVITNLLLVATGLVIIFLIFNSKNKEDAAIQTKVHEPVFNTDKISSSNLMSQDILVNPEKYPIFSENFNLTEVAKEKMIEYNHDSWKSIIPQLFLHSAYLTSQVKEKGAIIKIIALGQNLKIKMLKAHCLYKDNQTSWNGTFSFLKIFPENREKYISYVFLCFSDYGKKPQEVSLQLHGLNFTTEWLTVHNNSVEKMIPDIAVCVRPFFNNFNNLQLLAEFLSYYNAVGASRFLFYDYSSSLRTKHYLRSLLNESLNIITVNWQMPTTIGNSFKQSVQLTSIQHCLLHNSGTAKFVLLVDVNEFLIPRQHFTITELLDDLSKRSKRKVGSYSFRQSSFCANSSAVSSKNEFPLVTTTKILRKNRIWPVKNMANIIVRPETVIKCGIHFVIKHFRNWSSGDVPWQLALTHLYKPDQHECKGTGYVEDRTAESFKYEIMFSKPMGAYRNIS